MKKLLRRATIWFALAGSAFLVSSVARANVVIQGVGVTDGGARNITAVAGVTTNTFALLVTSSSTAGVTGLDAWSMGQTNLTTRYSIAGGGSQTIAATATRRSILFSSDTGNTVNARVGDTANTSTTVGKELTPGQSVGFNNSAPASWKIVNVSGVTAVVVIVTEERN